ncbi:hypothetical protein Hanom_Chr04g00313411 [Helianthus anomalus]
MVVATAAIRQRDGERSRRERETGGERKRLTAEKKRRRRSRRRQWRWFGSRSDEFPAKFEKTCESRVTHRFVRIGPGQLSDGQQQSKFGQPLGSTVGKFVSGQAWIGRVRFTRLTQRVDSVKPESTWSSQSESTQLTRSTQSAVRRERFGKD